MSEPEQHRVFEIEIVPMALALILGLFIGSMVGYARANAMWKAQLPGALKEALAGYCSPKTETFPNSTSWSGPSFRSGGNVEVFDNSVSTVICAGVGEVPPDCVAPPNGGLHP